jgi:hypothetical protein
MEVLLAAQTSHEENQETSAVKSKFRNAGKKVSPASAFLRLVNCVSQASTFRIRAVRYRWSRISPGLPSYTNCIG